MRRQGHYGGDSSGSGHHSYGGAGAQSHQQEQNNKYGYYPARDQDQQPLADNDGRQQHQNQWRWERDAGQPKLPQTAMSPTSPFTEGKGHEASRSYYQSQRPHESRIPFDKQGGADPRSQIHEEDMDVGYEDDRNPQTFEGLEQMFLDNIKKLSKELTDAEDSENSRHRERINIINEKYQEHLVALRAQHSAQKEEFLRRESQVRKQQYDQITMEMYPGSSISHGDQREYNAGATIAGEPPRTYNSDQYYDTYRERGRLHARDHGFETKVPYPRGRSYETGSRYH